MHEIVSNNDETYWWWVTAPVSGLLAKNWIFFYTRPGRVILKTIVDWSKIVVGFFLKKSSN